MKKFNVEVTRIDRYTIEVDEKIYEDPKWQDNFREFFWDIEDSAEVAEHLAKQQARFGSGGESCSHLEGFGYVTRNGELPYSSVDFDKKGNSLPADKRRQPAPGLNIIIEDEDNDIMCEVTEIKN